MSHILRLHELVRENTENRYNRRPLEDAVTAAFHHSSDISVDRYLGSGCDRSLEKYYVPQAGTPPGAARISLGASVDFGENERMLLGKIVFGDEPIITIVGAMGSGKSTFIRVLRSVFGSLRVDGKDPFGGSLPVFRIVDASQTVLMNPTKFSEEAITRECIKVLCSKLEAVLSDFGVTAEEELIEFWNEMVQPSDSAITDDARDYIVAELRDRNLFTPNRLGAYAKPILLEERLRIKQSLKKEDPALFLKYLVEMISVMRRRRFPNFRSGVVIVFDNLDPISPAVIARFWDLVCTHMRHAAFRIVVPMRLSTFRSRPTTQWQHLIDYVPHSGHSPVTVISRRLDDLAKIVDETAGEPLREYAAGVIAQFKQELTRRNGPVQEFVLRVSGYSIRRALVLAQFPFLSPLTFKPEEASPGKTTEIPISNFIRALICGSETRYAWSPKREIDNLFSVHGVRGPHYLVKLRLLRAIAGVQRNGWPTLSEVVELGLSFGYTRDLVRVALNEMMSAPKRLIWTDSLLEFVTVPEMEMAKHSRVYSSKSGKGYLELVRDVNYVQEMMLDTFVDERDWGMQVSFGQSSDRLKAVIHFLKILLRADMVELRVFSGNGAWSKYSEYFGDERILAQPVREITAAIERIVDSHGEAGDSEVWDPVRRDCESLSNLAGLSPHVAAKLSSEMFKIAPFGS